MEQDPRIDLVLMTALTLERDALLGHVREPREVRTARRTYHRARVGPFQAVLFSLDGMGNVQAGVAAAEAIAVWNPAYMVMTGIAGGVKKKNERLLGDVLVANQVVDYELGKETPEGTERRYQVYRPARVLLEAAKNVPPIIWQAGVKTSRPDGSSGRTLSKVHFGSVASGQKVVTDTELVDELRETWVELIGIEMEAVGLALAVYLSDSGPGFLVVKGVSDWADPKKEDGWQPYAAEASAAFTVALLERVTFEASGRQQVAAAGVPRTYGGAAKLVVCQRLTADWADLADYFEVPQHQRAAFARGREPHGVWEWLEQRGKLAVLPEGLKAISRKDLIEEFSRFP